MFIYQASVDLIGNVKETVPLQIDSCVAAGYTGRNQDMVQAHIDELKKIGVPAPYGIPAMYWISPARLTSDRELYVVGEQTSPEVEFFLAEDDKGSFYITVASDHTDRELEVISIGKAKQICDKILGDSFWKLTDIADHWDEILISSKVQQNDQWTLYQSGTLSQILQYKDLLNLIKKDSPAGQYPSLLSGTIPVIGGDAIFTPACEITMTDPVLNRSISKRYDIIPLPDRS